MHKTLTINKVLIFLVLVSLSGIDLMAQYPSRIISLAPSLTKNLYLLEAEDLLIGCTNYCTLQSETDAEVVASAVQVNYEKAMLLQPDLVISTDLIKANTLEKFRKMGFEVLVFKNPESFEEICKQFVTLGEKIGKIEKAQEVIQKVNFDLQQLISSIPQKKNIDNPKAFFQLGANPLFAVVSGMFMDDLLKYSAAENVLSDLTLGSINKELVLVRDPDYIIIVLMGDNSDEEIKKWKHFKNLKAVKNNKIFTLDPDDACSPTPVSFVRALEEMITKMYRLT